MTLQTGGTLTAGSLTFTVHGRIGRTGMLVDDAFMKGRHDHDLE